MAKLFKDVFAPKKIKDMVLPDRIMDKISGDGIPPNMIFYGPPGTGKSQSAKLIAGKYIYKRFDISLDGRIETLRTGIAEFCENVQMSDDPNIKTDIKVVLLDEIDGASAGFFDALRGFMDEYDKKVRFICTCNHFHKVTDAIKSRFGGSVNCINFAFVGSEEEAMMLEKYRIRIKQIMGIAGMTNSDGSLDKVIDNTFPDYRGILQLLQRLFENKTLDITASAISETKYSFKELYDLILSAPTPEKFHTLLMGEYATKASDVLKSLDEGLVDYIINDKPTYNQLIPNIMISVAKYMDMSTRIDPAMAMKACCFELSLAAQRINK